MLNTRVHQSEVSMATEALLQRLAAVRGRLSLCADQAAAAKWGGKREPQKIPPFRIVEFFGGVVRGMTTRQRLPHLSEALWRDAETPGNSATPVPGPQ
ncbi:hypothetical protein ASV21_23115 [Enterobacter hormaechei subsp. steigerwaltii]|nr:hypothetical protein ASV21_23115 [Enterobacter hormaechei subsp. steigerwaltii]